MASPAELSLIECKPHSYSLLLKSVGEQQHTDQTQKLEEFLARLEEERLKIDAFKRELPLCMQLLNNAMETSRQQLQSYISANHHQGPKPVLEQFIPLQTTAPIITTSNCEGGGSDQKNMNTSQQQHTSDKANWMISAQLWSTQATGGEMNNQQSPPTITETTEEIGFGEKQINGLLPELTLASSDKELEEEKKKKKNHHHHLELISGNNAVHHHHVLLEQQGPKTNASTCHGDHSSQGGNSNNTLANNPHRKARRCWSPDLHRRFVNALQMLGGSQVATPKQIRELMKVDGLTNDEVKSHLQKYRLHTRRPSPSPQVAATGAAQLVVLGGIWVPPEYAAAAAAAHGGATAAALYGTHATTHHASGPHYCATPLPQEYYSHAPSSAPPHQQLHHHHHHQLYNQIHVYQPPPPPLPSHTQNSPESDFQGGGGSGGGGGLSESMEDGKSESGSWKGDSSGENEGRRKALVVREEGEESNGSEITLKF